MIFLVFLIQRIFLAIYYSLTLITSNDVILLQAVMVDSNSKTAFLAEDFQIPTYILKPESEVVTASNVPACPVIVFINSKSGGQLGGNLLVTFRSLLNENQVPLVSCELVEHLFFAMGADFEMTTQVFDLGDEAPDKVLHKIYVNLEKLKHNGDEFAGNIEKRLRLIVSLEMVDTFLCLPYLTFFILHCIIALTWYAVDI